MSEDTGEPKRHEASASKLRKARRDGQFAKSAMLVENSRVITVSLFLLYFLFFILPGYLAEVVYVVGSPGSQDYNPKITGELFVTASQVFLSLILILIVTSVLVVAIHALSVGGLPVSAKPMAPKGEKVSPAQNIKKLFKPRHITEVLVAWWWSLLWFVSAAGITYLGVARIMAGTTCVVGCTSLDFVDTVIRLLIVLFLLLIIAGLIDLAIQKSLFGGEMRMTDSERKRDHRETEGDPHVKREVRRRGQDGGGNDNVMRLPKEKRSLSDASCLLVGSKSLVAIRYSEEDDPRLPYVIQSMPLNQVDADTAQAIAMSNLPRVEGARVADKIAATAVNGSVVPQAHLMELMRTLYHSNLVN